MNEYEVPTLSEQCMTFKIRLVYITFTGLQNLFPDMFMFSRTVGTMWISQ